MILMNTTGIQIRCIFLFLAHLAQSARRGIVRGLSSALCVVRRQQLLQRSSFPKLYQISTEFHRNGPLVVLFQIPKHYDPRA